VGGGSGGDPGWEQPGYVLQGTPEQVAQSLRELAAMGVNHLQIPVRARSLEEFCDQVAASASWWARSWAAETGRFAAGLSRARR